VATRKQLTSGTALLMGLCLLIGLPHAAHAAEPIDVWLDVDTANGKGDVDDGLMLIQAFQSPELRVRGVSVQFGNSTLEHAVPIARHIIDRYGPNGMIAHPGAASADDYGKDTQAVRAMAAALKEQPMHILAVGPVTNAGTLVKNHPELHDRIESIVMVAARRVGQKFEVADDQARPFRDANFEKDVPAMRAIIESEIPVVFAPWEVSTSVWLRPDDLAMLRQSGGAGEWIDRTSQYWIQGWKHKLGTDGFTPFDTLAVAWFTDREGIHYEQMDVTIEMGPDDGARPVDREPGSDKPYLHVRPATDDGRHAIYTYKADPSVKQSLMPRLSGQPGQKGAPSGPIWAIGDETFDHSAFDALLKSHVDDRGLVNYATLAADAKRLDAYIESLGTVTLDDLSRDERLAFLLNAYNALTLRLILDHMPVDSIKDIPADERWKAPRWDLDGQQVSLDRIEHLMIRPVFNDPRIHWALVCAGKACPPLRDEAYTGDDLHDQLDDQTRIVHTDPRWLDYDPQSNTVTLTPLYRWYRADFVKDHQPLLPVLARWNPALRAALADDREPTIQWADYDWSLNDTDQ